MNKTELTAADVNWRERVLDGIRRCLTFDEKECEGCPYSRACVRDSVLVIPETMAKELMRLLEKKTC